MPENYEASSIKDLSAQQYRDTDNLDENFLPEGGYGRFFQKVASGLNI